MIARVINSRYEILERTGDGPFFQVYKTRDKVLGRVSAVKTVNPPFDADQAFVQALKRSATSLLDLTHPNIARIYDMGDDAGELFLVTEYVRGINLKERIRRIAPFTVSVAVDFAIAIAEALQHAHSQGVVHGDLRPQNVIVSPEGAVKVTDFCVAPALAASPTAAAANLERAAHYEAPEIAAGNRPSASSDLYALGAILFEMLTGAPPYAAETPLQIVRRHQDDPIPSPRGLNPGVPRALEAIVVRALAKSPEERYGAAAEVLRDLRGIRDALRFGKPLTAPTAEATAAAALSAATAPPSRTSAPSSQAPAPAPAQGAVRMPAATVTDDRISPFLKFALGTVIFIILTAVIAGTAVWMAVFSKQPDQVLPGLVGMKIEAARDAAGKMSVRLLEHEEYNDKFDPGVVYKYDWQPGKPIRPGRSINVWVSKGSRLVWVPDVLRMPKEDAEKKLKDAGLNLGTVDPEFSDSVPQGSIVSQNPRAGKRVNREVAVNLIVSDGPKPQPQPDASPTGAGQNAGTNPNIYGGLGNGVSPPTNDATSADEPRTFNLTIDVKPDHRGRRRVRIEYDDARGTHTTVDEDHNEGDKIDQRIEVYGSKLTVRVYYGDDTTPAREQTIPLAQGR